MLDFGALPPEVTSTLMHTGPGSGSLMAAASAWDALAAQLDTAVAGYLSTIAEMQSGAWAGPASARMAAAAQPYVQWLANTAALAQHAAAQARASAMAFETAHAGTVPPPVVFGNRTQLMNLVATNIFGQNTPAISATEAEYSGMWAQNTETAYGYAATASATSRLEPFGAPPQTTDPAGSATQLGSAAGSAGNTVASHASPLAHAAAAAPNATTGMDSQLPGWVQELATASPIEHVGNFNTLFKPTEISWAALRTFGNMFGFGVNAAKLIPSPPALASATVTGATEAAELAEAGGAGAAEPAVLASMSTDTPQVGGLSVPQAWADATPVAQASEEPMYWSDDEAADAAEAVPAGGLSPIAGVGPMAGAAAAAGAAGMAGGRHSVSSVLRVPARAFKMSRHSSAG